MVVFALSTTSTSPSIFVSDNYTLAHVYIFMTDDLSSHSCNGCAGSGSSRSSGWASGSSLALPFEGFSGRSGRMGAHNEPRMPPSGVRPKKVVTINIE